MHIGIASAWSGMSVRTRRKVADDDEEAVDAFVEAAITEICKSRRGDIFSPTLAASIREVLPSFLEALRIALEAGGSKETDVALFEHDWNSNKLELKARAEMRLVRQTLESNVFQGVAR